MVGALLGLCAGSHRCTMAAAGAGLVKVSTPASLRDSQLQLARPSNVCSTAECFVPVNELLSRHCAVCVVLCACLGSAVCKACQWSQQAALLCKQGGMFPSDSRPVGCVTYLLLIGCLVVRLSCCVSSAAPGLLQHYLIVPVPQLEGEESWACW